MFFSIQFWSRCRSISFLSFHFSFYFCCSEVHWKDFTNFKFSLLVQCNRLQCFIGFSLFFYILYWNLWSFLVSVLFLISHCHSQNDESLYLFCLFANALSTFALYWNSQDKIRLQTEQISNSLFKWYLWLWHHFFDVSCIFVNHFFF